MNEERKKTKKSIISVCTGGWRDCQFRGMKKMVYAYIYGYNYHERGFCYVAEQLGGGVFGVSAETMNSIINKLLENGYLFKDARGLFWCDKFKGGNNENKN